MDTVLNINQDEPIIHPKKNRRPDFPSTCILALGGYCWNVLEEALHKFQKEDGIRKKNMQFYELWEANQKFICAGPVLGAPAAVMALEDLTAMGVQTVIALGCAGSLQNDIVIGDILLPSSAIVEEGTSQHYISYIHQSDASPAGLIFLRRILSKSQIKWEEGKIWTTDAPYRETKSKVLAYQISQIYAVEMETSALFTLAKYKNIALATVLVISDELGSLEWNPGFHTPSFRQSLARVAETLVQTMGSSEIVAVTPRTWD